jgi:hypothetical protein
MNPQRSGEFFPLSGAKAETVKEISLGSTILVGYRE